MDRSRGRAIPGRHSRGAQAMPSGRQSNWLRNRSRRASHSRIISGRAANLGGRADIEGGAGARHDKTRVHRALALLYLSTRRFARGRAAFQSVDGAARRTARPCRLLHRARQSRAGDDGSPPSKAGSEKSDARAAKLANRRRWSSPRAARTRLIRSSTIIIQRTRERRGPDRQGADAARRWKCRRSLEGGAGSGKACPGALPPLSTLSA